MMLEQSIAYRKQYNFSSLHLLMISLYGPRDNFNFETSHVIPAIIRKIANAKKMEQDGIVLWGDSNPTREFIYVEDAAKAIVLATENYNSSDPVNIGLSTEISISNLVKQSQI
jgi:GDP-L-fucose synthase